MSLPPGAVQLFPPGPDSAEAKKSLPTARLHVSPTEMDG